MLSASCLGGLAQLVNCSKMVTSHHILVFDKEVVVTIKKNLLFDD